jgi:CMP-N,N'-diacetyllegionaminic acid synthase
MNVVLLMGRRGSKSIPGKNVRPVLGRPLVLYPILAAKRATLIDRIFVSTDCPDIIGTARCSGVEVIERPASISGDESQMVDAIRHALEVIGERVEFLVTMHANCATHRVGLIDDCIRRLQREPGADSCVSGTVDRAIHPYRTRRLLSDGTLQSWMPAPTGTSSNRQSLDPCVILDGAARALRVGGCFPIRGEAPFPYLGRTILFEENPGGRDVHDEVDLLLTERYLLGEGWTYDTVAPPSEDSAENAL